MKKEGGVLMKSSKGLSTIVSTLLIVLLVFVAIGIVWVVVRNLVTGGSEQIDVTSKCLQVSVVPTQVSNQGNEYNVTLSRTASGGSGDEIGGVKLIFSSSAGGDNEIIDVPGNIQPLGVVTESVTVSDVPDPDTVGTSVYFIDDSGNEQLCQGTENLRFS